ncbi:flagellar biosynthesis protein FliQ [Motiliproteus sp. SC1-56]|uniref:flagellar biosynthesis protein FliQ n=1 Tax=Motiliproteus sp. SC1-56 TaxID=2799565 RepID=UPI001A8F9147|nr:flagellar biosynthesis protein FliQ [Motiliproteus sp. SC1-56]
MEQGVVLDLYREAFFMIILIVSVLVVPGLIVGLIIAVFQAATQINEQTLSFLPRLLVTLGAVMWAGSWILTTLTDYFDFLFHNIPLLIG